MNDNAIKIVLAFCDPTGEYARHVGVVMASIFTNTKEKVCIYLLHDDTLTIVNRKMLVETATRFGQEAEFINVQDQIGDCVPLDKQHSAGRATYFRLLIPSLFLFDQVIYMDCDIIVTTDIKELWDAPIADYALAAVLDTFAYAELKGMKDFVRLKVVYKRIGLEREKYFNAGVLLMNLRKIREAYFFQEAVIDFFSRYGKIIPFADQDFLNYFFKNDCLILDDRFCKMDFADTGTGAVQGYILHLICDDKPWYSYTRPYVDNLYWEYLALTPFCEDSKALIKIMLESLCTDEFYHLHSSTCTKHYKKKMLQNLKRGHLWRLPVTLLRALLTIPLDKTYDRAAEASGSYENH